MHRQVLIYSEKKIAIHIINFSNLKSILCESKLTKKKGGKKIS